MDYTLKVFLIAITIMFFARTAQMIVQRLHMTNTRSSDLDSLEKVDKRCSEIEHAEGLLMPCSWEKCPECYPQAAVPAPHVQGAEWGNWVPTGAKNAGGRFDAEYNPRLHAMDIIISKDGYSYKDTISMEMFNRAEFEIAKAQKEREWERRASREEAIKREIEALKIDATASLTGRVGDVEEIVYSECPETPPERIRK